MFRGSGAGWRNLCRAALGILLACSSDRTSSRQHARLSSANDRTESCSDLTDARICWDAHRTHCPDGICVTARPVPDGPAPSLLGWRCSGRANARTCVDRQKGVGAFVRDGELWVERHPRLPDDGEWTCGDMGGAAVCSGGDAPAGVAVNVADPGWICGTRMRPENPPGPAARVCVDFAPDFPDGKARGWRCRYATEKGLARVCQRDSRSHELGDPCDGKTPCLDGLRCVEQHCVPEKPDPACAFDRDCESGVCRFGSCRELDR